MNPDPPGNRLQTARDHLGDAADACLRIQSRLTGPHPTGPRASPRSARARARATARLRASAADIATMAAAASAAVRVLPPIMTPEPRLVGDPVQVCASGAGIWVVADRALESALHAQEAGDSASPVLVAAAVRGARLLVQAAALLATHAAGGGRQAYGRAA